MSSNVISRSGIEIEKKTVRERVRGKQEGDRRLYSFHLFVDFSFCIGFFPCVLCFSHLCVRSTGLMRIDGESITVKRIDQVEGEPGRWPSDAMLKGIYPLTYALTFY